MSAAESAIRGAARRTARRRFSLAGADCHVCGADAVARHHVNGQPRDNAAANVRFVCLACHGLTHSGERWHADRDPSRYADHVAA